MRTSLCLGGPLDGETIESEDDLSQFTVPSPATKVYDFRREVTPVKRLPLCLVSYYLCHLYDNYYFWICVDEDNTDKDDGPSIVDRLIAGYVGKADV